MPFDSDSGPMASPGDPTPTPSFDPNSFGNGWDMSENGMPLYQGINWGDLGYGGDPNNFNESNGLNDMFLKKLGWTGGNPYIDNQGTGEGSKGQYRGYTPEFNQFIQDKGLTFKTGDEGNTKTLQAFGPGGNTLGTYRRSLDPDTLFGQVFGTLASAAGGLAGGALASGYGSVAGAAGSGAGAGFVGGMTSSGGDIGAGLKGAAVGGLTGGVTQGINPSGAIGVTDPMYARALNGAVGSGTRAAITGGNIGTSVLGSLTNSGLSAAGQAGMDYLNNTDYNYGNEGRNYPTYQGDQTDMSGQLGGLFDKNYSTAPGTSPYPMADMISGGSQGQYSPDTTGGVMPAELAQNGAPQENPIKSHIMSLLNGAVGSPGKMDNMTSNLMDLYNRYRQNKQQGGLADNLAGLYGPNSPYAQRLGIALSRADARSGRRTQIGPRQVELQARLADLNSRNAPMLNQLYQQQSGNRNAMLGDLFRMGTGGANGGGGLNMIRDAGNWMNNYLNPVSPQATVSTNQDWAPGD